MLRPCVIALSVSLLAIAIATPLTAQRLEVAAHIGYSPASGTQYYLASGTQLQLATGYGYVVRSWDGGGFIIGAVASYWPLTHFGIQGTLDLRFTRHYATWVPPLNNCVGLPCLNNGPELVDTSATQLVASLRLAARQALGPLHLSASLGPAIIRFGDSEYAAADRFDWLSLANRYEVGVTGGLSAAYAFSSRVRLTVGTEDLVLRVHSEAASMSYWGWTTVVIPLEHEFTFSVVASVRVL